MSAEHDFIRAMSKEKRASLGEAASSFVHQHAKEIGAALIGAGLAAGTQYLSSRPGKDGGPSFEQRSTKAALKGSEYRAKQTKKEGREPTFREGIGHATSKSLSEYSNVLAKHPGKAALMAAPVGATAGLAILKALTPK